MAPLTADVHRRHSVHQPQFLPLPVKAGARIYLNAITCTDPTGLAVPAADVNGLRAQGVAWKGFDNTNGADGTIGDSYLEDAFNGFSAARFVEVDSKGEWEFNLAEGTPTPGDNAYIIDDNTVGLFSARSILIGKFTRPGSPTRPHSPGTWFVDIARR